MFFEDSNFVNKVFCFDYDKLIEFEKYTRILFAYNGF